MNLDDINTEREELILEAEEDTNFKLYNLSTSFNSTSLIIKWRIYKLEWQDLLRDKEIERKKTYIKNFKFYKDLKIAREEYHLFITTDSSYSLIVEEIAAIKETIKSIDYVVQQLKNKQRSLNSTVEYLKYKNGVGKSNDRINKFG